MEVGLKRLGSPETASGRKLASPPSLPSTSILNSKAFGGECCKQGEREKERMPGRSTLHCHCDDSLVVVAFRLPMPPPQKGGRKGRHRKSISQGVKASKIHRRTRPKRPFESTKWSKCWFVLVDFGLSEKQIYLQLQQSRLAPPLRETGPSKLNETKLCIHEILRIII